MNQPDLGKKIAELRKAKGFTQEELVEKCNLSVRTLQRIESGEVTPRSYTLKIIFAALDYQIHDMSEGTDSWFSKSTAVISNWIGQFYNYVIDLFNLKTNTMKKLSILSATIFVLCLVLISICKESEAQKPKEVIKIINASNRNYIHWFNNGQIDSLLTQFRDDACVVAKGCGKKFMQDFFKSESERYKFKELSIISISVSDTIAVEKGRWVVSLNSGGGVYEGEYLTEWRYSGRKWLMVNTISDSKLRN
jgi:transcriptional regulator with XRE-family HTH domain